MITVCVGVDGDAFITQFGLVFDNGFSRYFGEKLGCPCEKIPSYDAICPEMNDRFKNEEKSSIFITPCNQSNCKEKPKKYSNFGFHDEQTLVKLLAELHLDEILG